jgi:hypothetical protein
MGVCEGQCTRGSALRGRVRCTAYLESRARGVVSCPETVDVVGIGEEITLEPRELRTWADDEKEKTRGREEEVCEEKRKKRVKRREEEEGEEKRFYVVSFG